MNDRLLMQILQCLAQLVDVVASYLLCVSSVWLSLQVFIQLSTRSIFKDEVDLLVVPEEAIHAQDVVVTKM
jgi:hypothetical protein